VRLAPSEPLEVEAGHARLALSKGDCLPGYVERLGSIYAESHWEPAAHPTTGAAVRRQGLLWRLKAAVVYDPDEGAIARAMEGFRPTTA
jgi:hypothetical protein